MDTPDNLEEAIEVLQQLKLKEYEARCFVGLTRVPSATAKQLSEMTEVPRTRVYDAIRVLEAQGLVEVQHSSPQQFRAVSLDEATETLRDQYETRVERLTDALRPLENQDGEDEDPLQEVWAMSGQDAIENRTTELIADATDEVVIVIGDESLLTTQIVDALNGLSPDVHLLVGVLCDDLEAQIQEKVPGASTYVSGLDWLHGVDTAAGEAVFGRLLVVDRSSILASTIVPTSDQEQAVFGEGTGNGFVLLASRLMSEGKLLRPGRC